MHYAVSRFFLARGLGLSSSGLDLSEENCIRLNTLLHHGVTWIKLASAYSTAESLARKKPSWKHLLAFKELAFLARELLAHKLNNDVRNEIDLTLYIQELKSLDQSSVEFPIQVVFLLIDATNLLIPSLSILWKKETEQELLRKNIILQAGMAYERHEYPYYSNSFCSSVSLPLLDHTLTEAKKRLNVID